MTERRQVDSPPSKLPRLSGADANDGAVVTMARAAPATAPLVLGLGLGVGGSRSDSSGSDDAEAAPVTTTVVTLPRPSSALTFMQRQELEQQVLIYRYFLACAPVPVNLVLPIWNSVAASSPAPQRFPSLAGLGRMCFDARSSMEPEPDRCRRTDGKKWRCSRGVVPGCKYCERHVHRGRGRSRKPVEATTPTSAVPIRAVHADDAQAAPIAQHSPPPPQPQRIGLASPAGVFLTRAT